jgi:hypothetical protein
MLAERMRSRPLHTRYSPDSDLIMESMIGWGEMARKMPKTWDHEGLTYRIGSPDGEMGKILPGRGFMPFTPLRKLGITREHRAVYDPNQFQRLRDRLHFLGHDLLTSEIGAITTRDGIIAARGGGKANDWATVKASLTTTANVWYCNFATVAGMPVAGTYLATTAPTDQVPTRATVGSLSQYLSNPGGSDDKYLLTFGWSATQQINMACLVDCVNEGGQFRLSVTTAETVASPTNATRQYGSGNGVGNLLTFIVRTAGTPGAGTFIAQYVDDAAANTNAPTLTQAAAAVIADAIYPSSVAFTGANNFGLFVPLAAASLGVQAVKQTTCSVAGTGSLASNVFFPLMFVPGIAATSYIERDSTAQIDGLTELANASQVCGSLRLYMLPHTTSTGVVSGFFRTCAG